VRQLCKSYFHFRVCLSVYRFNSPTSLQIGFRF
jgi:hypothetical protein